MFRSRNFYFINPTLELRSLEIQLRKPLNQATKLYGGALMVIYVVFLASCIVVEFTVMEK